LSGDTEESSAEEVELGSAIHLAFYELELGDVALGLAVGPWQVECSGNCRLIGAKTAGEPGHRTRGRIVGPGVEAIRVPPSDHRLEPFEEMTGRGEDWHGVLDDCHGDRVLPGEMIALLG